MKEHFYYFNAFRLLAALIVLTCHARCEVFATYGSLHATSQSIFTQLFFTSLSFTTVAMSVFFLLSGFLVGGPMMQRVFSLNGREKAEMLLFRYLKTRLIRITPPVFRPVVYDYL